MRKIAVTFGVDDDAILGESGQECLEDAITQELGWCHDSGMLVESWQFIDDANSISKSNGRVKCLRSYVEDGTEYWTKSAEYTYETTSDGYAIQTNLGTIGYVGDRFLLGTDEFAEYFEIVTPDIPEGHERFWVSLAIDGRFNTDVIAPAGDWEAAKEAAMSNYMDADFGSLECIECKPVNAETYAEFHDYD